MKALEWGRNAGWEWANATRCRLGPGLGSWKQPKTPYRGQRTPLVHGHKDVRVSLLVCNLSMWKRTPLIKLFQIYKKKTIWRGWNVCIEHISAFRENWLALSKWHWVNSQHDPFVHGDSMNHDKHGELMMMFGPQDGSKTREPVWRLR